MLCVSAGFFGLLTNAACAISCKREESAYVAGGEKVWKHSLHI